MSFEDQLRSDLGGTQVPESLSPPADLADAVLVGLRRQIRRRVLLTASGLVFAVAVAGAIALSPQPDPGPVAPADPACGRPLPTRPPSQSREYFDPLTNEIDAGGVSGYQVRDFVATTYFQGIKMTNPAGDRSVLVVLYSAGGEPHYVDDNDKAVPFDPGAGEPAGSVDGAPAYWLPDGHFSGDVDLNEQGLAWQWAPGAWVFAVATDVTPGGEPAKPTASTASTVDPAELRSIAAQVAPQLELGVGAPVTSPFSMPVPDCTRLAMSVVSHVTADDGSPYVVFLLGFDTADKVAPTYPPPGDLQSSLLVIADTGAAPDDVDGLTEYPDDLGFPAYIDASEGILSVYEVFGFAVNVWPIAMPNADTGAEKASLAAGIFQTITIYPGAADSEAAWGDPIVP